MGLLIFFAIITLGVSGFCSLLEAIVLSTTTAEVEALKKKHLQKGRKLEKYKIEIEETSSAILTLNTVANTLGSMTKTPFKKSSRFLQTISFLLVG